MLPFKLQQRFECFNKFQTNCVIKYRLLSSYVELVKSSLNYINGRYEPGISKDCLEVIDPATGAPLCKIADSDISVVSSAVESAKVGFKSWSALSGSERSSKLMKAAWLLRSNIEEISRAEVKHTGKCIWEARLDTEGCASVLEYYAGVAPTIQGDHINLAGGSFAYLRREPLGVCGGIGAWNYPLQMAVWKSAPALACGNTMVFKPSNLTPLTACMLAEIYTEAGLPPGCFNVVQGGALAGQMLCSHSDVKKMSFTGSVDAGSKVMATSAKTIKYVTLELGGKSPLVIFNDADIDSAVSGALMANFLSQGQVCSNGTRVFVERQIYDEFVEKFVQRTKALKIGNPMAEDSKVGAMINTQHGHKVLTFINEAVQQGAKILCGGVRVRTDDKSLAGGFYMSPCVLTNVKDDMLIAREEVFGPVACVFPFDSEDEVLRRANDSPYGLAAGVFTKDIQRAHRFAAKIEAGNVYINNYNVYPVELPFGGFKQSGIGRECGLAVIQHYTQLKTVYVEMGKVWCPL